MNKNELIEINNEKELENIFENINISKCQNYNNLEILLLQIITEKKKNIYLKNQVKFYENLLKYKISNSLKENLDTFLINECLNKNEIINNYIPSSDFEVYYYMFPNKKKRNKKNKLNKK